MLGAVFDEALLRAVAIEPGDLRDGDRSARRGRSHPDGRARAYGRPVSVHARARARGGLPEPPAVPPDRAARAGGAGARARRRPAPGATGRPRSPRTPLEPQLGQAQGRPLSAGRRRLGARGLCERRCDPPLRARAPHPRRVPGLRRRGAGRARAARRSARVHRPAAEALAHYEDVRDEIEAAGDRGGGRSPAPEDRRALLGSGRSRARRTLLRVGPRAARRRRRSDRACAPLSGDGSARVSRRRQCRRHRMGRARPRGSGARGGWPPSSPSVRARPPPCARTPTTRSASRSRAWAAWPRRWTRSSTASRLAEARDLPQAACRGYTNLGVLYSSLDPRRAIETCLRGLETAKKVGDLGFQSRLYANLAVAYCALTDRCEAEGIEAAKHGHRPRPPAGACSITWRCR